MPDSHSTVNINIDWLRAAPASLLFFPAPEGTTTLNVTLTTNPHGTPYPTPESVGAMPESLPGHAVQTETEGKRRRSDPPSPPPTAKHPRTSSSPLAAPRKGSAGASTSSHQPSAHGKGSAGHAGPSKPHVPLPTFSSREYRQAANAVKLRNAAGSKKRSIRSPMARDSSVVPETDAESHSARRAKGQVASDDWFREPEVDGEIPPTAKPSNSK